MVRDVDIVIYDENCPLCVFLANFAGKRSQEIEFVPHAKDSELKSELKVIHQGQELLGDDAWLHLLKHHPTLRGINWVARKFGLEQTAAKTLNTSGHLARWFCRRCSP